MEGAEARRKPEARLERRFGTYAAAASAASEDELVPVAPGVLALGAAGLPLWRRRQSVYKIKPS